MLNRKMTLSRERKPVDHGTEKLCIKGNHYLPATLDFFYVKPDHADNLHPYCKECMKAYARPQRAALRVVERTERQSMKVENLPDESFPEEDEGFEEEDEAFDEELDDDFVDEDEDFGDDDTADGFEDDAEGP